MKRNRLRQIPGRSDVGLPQILHRRNHFILHTSVARQTDPLLDLLARYDCSQFYVAGMKFLPEAELKSKGWFVARQDEGDLIYIDPQNGEVCVEEIDGMADAPVYRAAASSGQFFDAF